MIPGKAKSFKSTRDLVSGSWSKDSFLRHCQTLGVSFRIMMLMVIRAWSESLFYNLSFLYFGEICMSEKEII